MCLCLLLLLLFVVVVTLTVAVAALFVTDTFVGVEITVFVVDATVDDVVRALLLPLLL